MSLPVTIMVVRTEIPAESEDAFNAWYDDVHLPEITSCPGFIRSARYVTEEDGRRRYLAIYELEDENALSTPEFAARRGLGPFGGEASLETRVYKQRITLEANDA